MDKILTLLEKAVHRIVRLEDDIYNITGEEMDKEAQGLIFEIQRTITKAKVQD